MALAEIADVYDAGRAALLLLADKMLLEGAQNSSGLATSLTNTGLTVVGNIGQAVAPTVNPISRNASYAAFDSSREGTPLSKATSNVKPASSVTFLPTLTPPAQSHQVTGCLPSGLPDSGQALSPSIQEMTAAISESLSCLGTEVGGSPPSKDTTGSSKRAASSKQALKNPTRHGIPPVPDKKSRGGSVGRETSIPPASGGGLANASLLIVAAGGVGGSGRGLLSVLASLPPSGKAELACTVCEHVTRQLQLAGLPAMPVGSTMQRDSLDSKDTSCTLNPDTVAQLCAQAVVVRSDLAGPSVASQPQLPSQLLHQQQRPTPVLRVQPAYGCLWLGRVAGILDALDATAPLLSLLLHLLQIHILDTCSITDQVSPAAAPTLNTAAGLEDLISILPMCNTSELDPTASHPVSMEVDTLLIGPQMTSKKPRATDLAGDIRKKGAREISPADPERRKISSKSKSKSKSRSRSRSRSVTPFPSKVTLLGLMPPPMLEAHASSGALWDCLCLNEGMLVSALTAYLPELIVSGQVGTLLQICFVMEEGPSDVEQRCYSRCSHVIQLLSHLLMTHGEQRNIREWWER